MVGSEKARSEFIIAPFLVELKDLVKDEISIFSGKEFNVDKELGLNGVCDFLISKSSDQLTMNPAPRVGHLLRNPNIAP
jgi:hypothetical protein